MGVVAVTAVVLVQDEEELIARCVSSLGWAAEVLVLDSGSQDRTRAVAEELGARVVHQPWLGWSRQRNRGAELARHDWVLFVDADEVITPGLARSIEQAVGADPDPRDGYALDRRNEFLGRVMPNSQRREARESYVRLYNRRHSSWDEAMAVHEQVVVDGSRVLLPGELLHWRRQSVDELVTRLNRYATVEAEELRARGTRHSTARLVALPVMRFCWHLIVKGELRRGTHGVAHASVRAIAEAVRLLKLWELGLEPTPVHPPSTQPHPARR